MNEVKEMNTSALIHTEIQEKWIAKLDTVKDDFRAKAEYNDIHSHFPMKILNGL